MKVSISFLLLAVSIWIAATVVASFSERSFQLIDDGGVRSLYSDRGAGTALNWIDQKRQGFSCLFLQSTGVRFCGMNIQMGDGARNGKDFRAYTKLRLTVEYKGSAEKFRVSYRNVINDPSIPDTKFHQVEVPIRKGAYIYEIPLSKFEVAPWWIEMRQIKDPEMRLPTRDNVVHFGFDIETPLPVGQHYFDVLEYSAVAPFFTEDNLSWWIGGSIAYFIIVGLFYNFLRLRSQLKQRHEEMFGLLKKLEEVDSESAHFKKLSMYDPLTGLLNRRAALDVVSEFALRNSLAGTALVVMDIDHFKQVNDTYGHEVGDEVLKSVATLVQQIVREGDAAVRWGGEEIVVICPKTNADGAYRVAEKLRTQIKQLRFSNPELVITASFGVANIRQGESFSQALGRADEALYEAKKSGRDQICGHKS